jgi:Fe2+ or Zn2+ uptake regulation protein
MPDDIAQLLREHEVQITAQRIAIMKAIAQQPHGTAEEITELVRNGIGTISRQAVYDSLGLLVERGLLRRIQPAGSHARYEDRVGDNHHHVVCRSCGGMSDVEGTSGEAPPLPRAGTSGYSIEETEIIYWGTCPDCLHAGQEPIQA